MRTRRRSPTAAQRASNALTGSLWPVSAHWDSQKAGALVGDAPTNAQRSGWPDASPTPAPAGPWGCSSTSVASTMPRPADGLCCRCNACRLAPGCISRSIHRSALARRDRACRHSCRNRRNCAPKPQRLNAENAAYLHAWGSALLPESRDPSSSSRGSSVFSISMSIIFSFDRRYSSIRAQRFPANSSSSTSDSMIKRAFTSTRWTDMVPCPPREL